ncbi:hypothetical protein MPNT_180036 [Candidatus Methylacidithermus pantelleriae]|uniref:Uncharacterized protein n=1 Tax=Candidatus Methylacidithermus pantelleriae TaxID=2744239 RepID=A0A8J2FVR7_9BACT|nr:hypothetical protein MPNT_180036 [Candidatus Methylacidithermus pantelleriae]
MRLKVALPVSFERRKAYSKKGPEPATGNRPGWVPGLSIKDWPQVHLSVFLLAKKLEEKTFVGDKNDRSRSPAQS